MAQNHQTNNPLYKALEKKYIADIEAAKATIAVSWQVTGSWCEPRW